jgi:hypothetical protein
MRRVLIEYRFVISLALAAIAGGAGLRAWPFPAGNPLLGLIAVQQPAIYAGFAYAYATAWFSTPFLLMNIVGSFVYIFVARADRRVIPAALPPYPQPDERTDLFLVLGEQHHRVAPTPAAAPRWLIIPERGLYTGIGLLDERDEVIEELRREVRETCRDLGPDVRRELQTQFTRIAQIQQEIDALKRANSQRGVSTCD